jgi:predicted Zn-dependent protease
MAGAAWAEQATPAAIERPFDAGDEGRAVADLDHCLDRRLPDAEAARTCERAAATASELAPSQQAALAHRRGQIALDQGRHAEAAILLEAAHRQEPTVAPYLLTLGDALLASGDTTRAIAVYREGQEVAPSSKVFRDRLAGLSAAPRATAPAVARR